METTSLSLVFNDFAYLAQKTYVAKPNESIFTLKKSKPTLHLALLYGEQLCFPSRSEWLIKVISGIAWISFGGEDFYLTSGESLAVPKVKNGAIISAMGEKPVFIEIT
jgi:hypothetical protein